MPRVSREEKSAVVREVALTADVRRKTPLLT
jgi:hypothetical protein